MGELGVPDLVVQRASRNGVAGLRWLARLPGVVAELSDCWGLTLGPALAGGTSGYLVAVTDSSGRECVLKIAMSLDMDERDAFVRSVRAHQLAAGTGCAELLAHDAAVPAMLLEQVAPMVPAEQLGAGDQHLPCCVDGTCAPTGQRGVNACSCAELPLTTALASRKRRPIGRNSPLSRVDG